MAVSDTLIDTLFDERYRIVRRLGSGGMATVYLAEDEVLGRRVAIKILNERYANDEQFVERFRREAKSAAGLSHPNIVSIYDRGEAEGTYYIAMEHLDGRTLKQLILARGPAPPHVAIDYTRQLLSALRFAHRNGIVHRDIKPHNVIVDAEGRAKVTDFGIARAAAASQMTEAGSIVGTAQYLSPEQARGGPLDHRSDLYSVGIVLYELLTGTLPFTGDSPVEVAMKHLSETPRPPSERREGVPEELDLVVMRALAKDPDERYQTAEEMDADLQRVARGLNVSRRTEEAATRIIAAPVAMPTTVTRTAATVRDRPPPAAPPVYYDYDEPPRRRRPLWPWLLALLLLSGALVAGFLVYEQIQEQLAETKPVEVPRVVGLRQLEATAKIREAGLVPSVTREFSDDVEAGFVISQDPGAGALEDRGDTVRLVVSRGKEEVEVPALRGKSQTDAVAALTELGLRYRIFEVNSEQEEGTVTGQFPAPGTRVEKGTRVRVNVSKGPPTVQVPSVIGRPFEDASAALQQLGFGVARGEDVDSNQPAGLVVAQNPAGGNFLQPGQTVTLQVSRGPQTVPVPNVVNDDEASASATLSEHGFQVRVQRRDVRNANRHGMVLEQNPRGGSQAAPGSRVTIMVGRFVEPEPPPPEEGELPPLP
ncbi:MAG: Stk1 family PASTA domain-containing Ser/Thr kinase [Thermoleophilia bacterium]|nr:Stk1 family PASTA domain-containing Ser/Thr kinase [Thermoleophilia bacterium]